MSKIRCIVVDDEPLAIDGMLMNIEELPNLEVLGTFQSAMDANIFLSINDVDLMFLDISMPGISGIDFLKTLDKRPIVIMTTAHPDYALESFELGVIDYLVKPFRMHRFVKAVNKATELFNLRNLPCADARPEFVYIRSEGTYVRLKYDDIISIEGMKDYVKLKLQNSSYLTAMNVKTIFNQLPKDIFARVNQSNIINVKYILEITNDIIKLPELNVTLSKTYKESFLKNYIAKNLIGR